MPIQINELTVTVEVTDSVQQANATTTDSDPSNADLRALIKECVDEVMEVMKKQKER